MLGHVGENIFHMEIEEKQTAEAGKIIEIQKGQASYEVFSFIRPSHRIKTDQRDLTGRSGIYFASDHGACGAGTTGRTGDRRRYL